MLCTPLIHVATVTELWQVTIIWAYSNSKQFLSNEFCQLSFPWIHNISKCNYTIILPYYCQIKKEPLSNTILTKSWYAVCAVNITTNSFKTWNRFLQKDYSKHSCKGGTLFSPQYSFNFNFCLHFFMYIFRNI